MKLLEMLQEKLTETVDHQKGFEHLAIKVLDSFATRIVKLLPDIAKRHELPLHKIDLESYPAILLQDVNNGKIIKHLPRSLQKFVEDNPTLRFEISERTENTKGYYRRRPSQPEIVLLVDKEALVEFQTSLKSGLNWYNVRDFLFTTYETLIHELVHAYDDWVSNGNYRTFIDFSYEEYLKKQEEVNARFYQVVSKLNPNVTWKEFRSGFIYSFDGWHLLSEEQRKRLLKRLSRYYLSQQPPKLFNPSKQVKKLEGKLRKIFGDPLFISYSTASDTISVSSFANATPNWSKILPPITKLADTYRKTIVTSDIPENTAKEFGFIKNKGRNKNYKISEKFYRLPRRVAPSQFK